jgi:peptide/nickel transport system permease protein
MNMGESSGVEPVSGLPLRAGDVEPLRSGRGRIIRRFLHQKSAVAGLVFLLILVVVAIFAPLIAPHDPNAQDLSHRLSADTGVLGTDRFGRDQLSRLIYGVRISLLAAPIAVGIAAGIGVPLGILAGYLGGAADAVLSRISDALQSVPGLIFALSVIAVLGPGLVKAMIAVGIVTIPTFMRLARAATIDVGGHTFVEASRAIGCSRPRIIWHHLVPNILSPLVVQVAFALGAAVTAEASLSFLGVGVRVPTASWGSMLSDGASNVGQAAFLVYPPGLLIAATVLSFILVGDGLRNAFGTRQILGSDST